MCEAMGDERRPLETKYGAMPLQDRLARTYADELNDQQAELVTKGMETLVGVLGKRNLRIG